MTTDAPPPYEPSPGGPSLTPPPYAPPATSVPPAFDPTALSYPGSGYPVASPSGSSPAPVGYPGSSPASAGYPGPTAPPVGYPGSAAPPLPPGARAFDMPTGLFQLILPAGWPLPPLSWIAEWAGKPVSPGQPPAGADPIPAGWVFWQPVEPLWSQWYAKVRSAQLKGLLIGGGIAVAAAIFTIVGYLTTVHGGTYYVLTGAILAGAVTAIRSGIVLAKLTRDPWSLIRQAIAGRVR